MSLNLDPTLPPFTVAEAAPLLAVSTDTVYESVTRGEIHALRLGRAIRIPRREVARLLLLTSEAGPHSPASADHTAAEGRTHDSNRCI